MPDAQVVLLKEAPDFTLVSDKGETVSLHDYAGVKKVLLVMLRGFS